MSTKIVLHQWEVSPFCRKVGRMLEFKGLPFEAVNYNGLRGLAAQRLSPVGKLPVVDVDEQRIQDSTRIARFLDERFPAPPLYPTDDRERALAELWEDWADEALYFYDIYFRVTDPAVLDQFTRLICEGRSAVDRAVMKLTFRVAGMLSLKVQGLGRMKREDVEAEFARHLDRIEAALSPQGWLVGTNKTIADIAVGSQLLEVHRTTPQYLGLDRRAKLKSWLDRL